MSVFNPAHCVFIAHMYDNFELIIVVNALDFEIEYYTYQLFVSNLIFFLCAHDCGSVGACKLFCG